jgi:hypothetical protein
MTIPGYNTIANSLSYNNLQVQGNAGTGGNSFLTMGRRLNTSDDGPFANYITTGSDAIGTASGDTLWSSYVVSKDQDNDQQMFVSLHNDNTGWCHDCAFQRIAVGYFGSNSNSGGERYWSLLLNYTYHLSPVEVVIDEGALLVVRTIFTAGNTEVDLFVNPITLGNDGIPAPSISASTGAGNHIRSLATYLGNSPANARVDEIRMGTSYACVTPDSDVMINLPPTAAISMTPSTGMSPLSVTLDGSNSTDPESQALSYLWDFGDGSPSSDLANPPAHLYDELGQITVSLTVTDDLGQEHTSYEVLTLLDPQGNFPCQSTVTCIQMASCNADDGILRVNSEDNFFTLRNTLGEIITPTNANEFHGLAAENYSLTISGNNSTCMDSFDLQIRTDSTSCVGWEPSDCAMDIGTNITGLADWSVERPFRNLMKNIRPDIITYSDNCGCWDAEVTEEMSFDESGYPSYLPQTTSIGQTKVRYVLSSEGGNLRSDSTYVLIYDGLGTFNIQGITIENNQPNRLEFIAGPGNIIINLEQSTDGDHLRNFRLLTLADEFADLNSEPFYQSFIDKVSPFKLLRFMDWGSTNNSPLSEWSERSTPNYFTYGTGAGVPYEMMAQLANQLEQDLWICVPHQANNDFILQMATLFKDNLDEDRTIYLEYSNEVWNWIFEQAHYNNENKPSNLSYGRAMAMKAKNVFDIWHDVFDGEECRVKRVLGLQAGFNSLNEEILSQLPSDAWDYGSPTHYFGLDHSDQGNPVLTAASSYQDIMLNASNDFAAFSQDVKQDYRNVQVYGKEVITYEGGQHFVGNVFGIPYPYQEAMWEAQNSDEMYEMYNAVHDSIRMWGCKLAANFSLSSVQESVYGSWGVLPDIDVLPPYSETAKKYQALIDNIPYGNCTSILSWDGNYSINWSNPCNWDQNRIPNASDNVLIPSGTYYSPSVDMNGEAKSVEVALGAILTVLNGWNLSIH